MAIVYKNCAPVGDLTYTCDPCAVPEMGMVRSLCLIKEGVTVAVPLDLGTFTSSVEAGDIIVIPETRGSFDGGTPRMIPAYGDLTERKAGDDYVLLIKDPNYADNADFWEEVERHTWNLAFRSETQLHYVDASVQIMTKAPVEEDLNSQVVWNAEARWFSKTKPVITPVAPIATLLKCFEITD